MSDARRSPGYALDVAQKCVDASLIGRDAADAPALRVVLVLAEVELLFAHQLLGALGAKRPAVTWFGRMAEACRRMVAVADRLDDGDALGALVELAAIRSWVNEDTGG
jgi:hypothetical protein